MAHQKGYGRQLSAADIADGRHRDFVGGLWEDLGRLQFEFLCLRGLSPSHHLLDVGCGCLRGGVHFVRHLETGHYCGVDANASLIEAARHELGRAALLEKQAQLAISQNFDLGQFGRRFEYVLALSVFPHLVRDEICRCLVAVRRVLAPRGQFFATFFEAPPGGDRQSIVHQPGGIVTYHDRDPFHQSIDQMQALADAAQLSMTLIGDWNHPRDQKMLVFRRQE